MAMHKEEQIQLRLSIARDKLSVAVGLLRNGHYGDAISKAYYAMFYAGKALLLALDQDPHKHKGVVTMFGEKIARVGLTDPRYGRTLAKAERLRIDADYNEQYLATKEDAEKAIHDAEDFVNEAHATLKKIQARGKNHVH